MAGVFDRQIATAQRLIARYGQACQWHFPVPDVEDSPGYPTAGDAPDPYPVRIAWFSPRDIGRGKVDFESMFPGTEVPEGSEIGLMGAVPFTPDDTGTITRDGESVSVKSIDRLAPNGTPILYYIAVVR